MPFEIAKPFDTTVKGPTCKMSIKKFKSGLTMVKFMMSKSFVEAHMPGASVGDTFRVQYGTGEEKGKVMLVKHINGDVPLLAFGKHSYTLSAAGWRGILNATLNPTPCSVLLARDGSVVLKMPELK